ncbi:DUF2310 family Zn-ribbon-containing protein [Acinetobacter beijerinckii]|uniref:Nucleic acid-binding protein n=1 Tax=Acinetobacter beijerinckii ANC 3835 TaxID=1217649 RepID=N9DYJ4_9GAMM|nr:DUF2310 family Zn-ribbon-containing protein [Acinetobacter beijerinckii]ENW03303.1 hypothetical protein F934_02554 [Acinetobacter beijerinckii ANC 3835]
MIAYKVIFGPITKTNREDAEWIVEDYISILFHNGQVCGENFLVVQNGLLCTYINLQGINANLKEYHCKYGIERLKRVIELFGCEPLWECIDDDVPEQNTHWQNASFLYLYTHMNDWQSPVCRGDSGHPIPIFILSGEHKQREEIYFWQQEYKNCDQAWIHSGALEKITYKQLAIPDSELSKAGQNICKYIEEVTGIPTYYYLQRYWGRRRNEDKRLCPSCGQNWSTGLHSSEFHHFAFQCNQCRLVSHLAVSYEDERHAVIGEWRNSKIK